TGVQTCALPISETSISVADVSSPPSPVPHALSNNIEDRLLITRIFLKILLSLKFNIFTLIIVNLSKESYFILDFSVNYILDITFPINGDGQLKIRNLNFSRYTSPIELYVFPAPYQTDLFQRRRLYLDMVC